MPRAPLTALLSRAWIAHAIEVDNGVEAAARSRGRRGPFRISLAMWTNGLRCIPEGGVPIADLRRCARADCNLGGLERWGWITIGEDASGRRAGYGTGKGLKSDTTLRPTRAGGYARRLFPAVVSQVEERWKERFGEEVIETLRGQLRQAAPQMPWSPPEIHSSDGFFTHVIEGESVMPERPLVAMLGQALIAITLEQEREARVSLPLAANVLRAIGESSVRVRDLPRRTGLSKEAIAMAVGWLERRALVTSGHDRTVGLTPAGVDAFGAYLERANDRADGPLRAALQALLERTDELRAGLVPPDGCWRNQGPYLAQTQRVLADPASVLPWHPMVLHRGGWPDGS